MSDETQRVTLYFRIRLDQTEDRGPHHSLVEALSSPTLEFSTLDSTVSRADRKEEWFRKLVLDLLLNCVGSLLEDRPLSDAELATIGDIKKHLDVREGDFFKHRPVEIAGFLCAELEKILDDLTIDTVEDVYQVELQRVFDLSYDQYLQLARRAFEEARESLQAGLRVAEQTRDSEQLRYLAEKARFLEPIFQLALSQPRTIGALY
jgi:hypothetical protein